VERPTRGNQLGERRPFDQLEHERVGRRGVLEAVDVSDIWMIQGCQDLRLAPEPGEPIGIGRKRVREESSARRRG
jgi:hypothetical protein